MKHSRLLYVLPALVGAATASMSPTSTGREAPCTLAEQWVKENLAALPATLSEISHFERAYRQRIFAALPREIQLSLWHEQFDHYLRSPDLTSGQKKFIAKVDSNLAQLFVVGREVAERTQMQAEGLTLFGPRLYAQIFANLGVNTPDPVPGPRPAKPLDESLVDCDCNQADDYCWGSSICGPAGTCTQSTGGCGTLWCYPCNGKCT